MEDLYHNCRWCKHFYKDKCYRGSIIDSSTVELVWGVEESGLLSECITETLNSVKPEPFKSEFKAKLSEWNISNKRIDEFWKLFTECLVVYLDMRCTPELSEKISVLYQNYAENCKKADKGVEIKDPYTFYCKEWE